METINLEFNNQLISFERNEKDVMVNATEMAKAFGKRLDHFLRTDNVKEFIEELKLTPYGGSFVLLTDEQIIKSSSGSKTFFHRLLAYKFAAWLSPKFEIWVYMQIDKILFTYAKTLEETISDTVRLQKEIETKKEELRESTGYIELEKLQTQLKNSKSKRTNSTKKKFKEATEAYNLFNLPK
ncbi:MAG: KilA-N domain-containing protein [Bacteroidota bacterium]